MKNIAKYILYILGPIITVFWVAAVPPIGILVLIVFIVLLFVTDKGNENPLKAKIEQTASQFGIRYGTPEEKLEQLAAIAARAQEPEKKP